jgi:hypothetical protein
VLAPSSSNRCLITNRFCDRIARGLLLTQEGETLIAEALAVTVSEPFVAWDYNYLTPKGATSS